MKTLIASQKLTVKISQVNKKYYVEVNGEKVIDENGSEQEFNNATKAEDYAIRKFIEPYIEKNLNDFIQADNSAILAGAGSSISDNEITLGLTMKQLWESALEEIDNFQKFAEEQGIKESDGIERLLSRAQMRNTLDPDQKLSKKIKEVENHIVKKCSFDLPDNSNHEILFQKLSNRQSYKPRTKIFTLNYDTLFENAAKKTGTILLDGFSFTQPRYFHSNNFNMDIVHRENSRIKNEGNYLKSVVKFFKLHGSIDWYHDEKKNTTVQADNVKGIRQLIYPRDTKYEQTYSQPFFEMMAQFQQYLRKENAHLLIVGYSFQDNHLNNIIKEALISNPMLRVLIINPTIKGNDNDFRTYLYEKTKVTSRVTLWSAKFKNLVSLLPDKIYISPEEKENL